MASARLVHQLAVGLPARMGLLADIAEALGEAGVDVRAVSAYQRDGQGKFLFVTTDDAKARDALARFGSEVTDKTVVEVEMPDKPGVLEDAARRLAEADIDIEYVYGSAAQGPTGPMATLIFKTSDDAAVPGLF